MRTKNKILSILLIVVMAFAATYAFATAVTTSWTTSDVREVDYLTPGSVKTQLGTRLQGPLVAGLTTISACTTSASACNAVAQTATYRAYSVTSHSAFGNSKALANGYQGQRVTYILGTDGGQDFYVTPTTKTGFTNIQLNDANDSCTLEYINSTYGWIVVGNAGCTIN
jgi:hypothetical protein